MAPGRFSSTVAKNLSLSARYFLLELSRPEGFPDPWPGAFIHVTVPDGSRFFLRRPFSILDCDDRKISLIIVEKGLGTRLMRDLPPGSTVDFIGPLGCSFPSASGRRVLAVGGGVGIAPLYYWWRRSAFREGQDGSGRRAREEPLESRLLYGARTKEELFIEHFDWGASGVHLSTDDGSHGFEGTVVELARREIERSPADTVFSCGPTPMLKAMAALAAGLGLAHYVSLENKMACGMGACRSCVVPTRSGDSGSYKTVCRDGPVFDADTLIWEELPEV